MVADSVFRKLRKSMGIILITATLSGGLFGAAGWRGGKYAQRAEDQTELSLQLKENSALEEFLLDLRSHLAADAEIEHLFKPAYLSPSRDVSGSISSGDVASVECCKAEARRMAQYFKNRIPNDNPQVRTIGKWLSTRCSQYFDWWPRSR